MTRLTNSMVSAMQAKAIDKAGITAAREALDKRRDKMVEAMRIESLGGPEAIEKFKKLDAKFSALKKEAGTFCESGYYEHLINRSSSLRANLAGAAMYFEYHNAAGESEQRMTVRGRATFAQGHPLVDEFYRIKDERQALEDRRKTIQASVKAATANVTTVKRLLEAWPEAAELLPEAEAKQAAMPALIVKDLNAMIGLPSVDDLDKSN